MNFRDQLAAAAAAGRPPFRPQPGRVDVAPDSSGFVVVYEMDYGPRYSTEDPWEQDWDMLLRAAFWVVDGAAAGEPAMMADLNPTGLREDDAARYERRVEATRANVLALRATGLPWSGAAEAAAAPHAPTPEAAETARQKVADLFRESFERRRWLLKPDDSGGGR